MKCNKTGIESESLSGLMTKMQNEIVGLRLANKELVHDRYRLVLAMTNISDYFDMINRDGFSDQDHFDLNERITYSKRILEKITGN